MFERFSNFLKLGQKNPEQELAIAKRQLDIAWRGLGGQDGTLVRKQQIQQLLGKELQLVRAEIHTTSLASVLESAMNLDTEENCLIASNWLEKQKAGWQKKWLFREGNPFEIIEIKRRIIACKCAIDFLTPSENHIPIA